MATECFKLLQFCRIRIADLYSNGVPAQGAKSLYVSDQQISLTIALNLSTGDDFEQKTGCGDVCFSFKDRDKIKNLNLTLSICTHEPELTQLLVGGDLLTSGSDTVGYALPAVGSVGNVNGVSLEGWTKNIRGSTLDEDFPYVRWVFPRTYWTPSDKTFENGPIVAAFTGTGEENDNWFDGPVNDWDFESGRLWQYAGDTALPTASCEAVTLVAS